MEKENKLLKETLEDISKEEQGKENVILLSMLEFKWCNKNDFYEKQTIYINRETFIEKTAEERKNLVKQYFPSLIADIILKNNMFSKT